MAIAKDDVTASLKGAADTAHSAFTTAALIDPIGAKPLWVDSINATNTYLTALQQQLAGDDADIKAAQDALDKATQEINDMLGTLNDVAAAIQIVGQLLTLVGSVAKFFA